MKTFLISLIMSVAAFFILADPIRQDLKVAEVRISILEQKVEKLSKESELYSRSLIGIGESLLKSNNDFEQFRVSVAKEFNLKTLQTMLITTNAMDFEKKKAYEAALRR